MNEIRIIPVEGIPEIKVDDNLAEITFDVLNKSEIGIEKNDIFIVTQKLCQKVKEWREISQIMILNSCCRVNQKKL